MLELAPMLLETPPAAEAPPAPIRVGRTDYYPLFPGQLPALTPAERDGLRRSIRARGLGVPIVVDENNGIIDGINRLSVAAELGLDESELRFDVQVGLSRSEKRALFLELNLERRQLTQEQRREVVALKLRRNPERSNRQIANEVGVSDHTVATVRQQLESGAHIAHLERSTGKDGKSYPAQKPAPTAEDDLWAAETNVVAPIIERLAQEQTPASKPGGALDSLGKPVPDKLQAVFEMVQRFHDLREWLSTIRRLARDLSVGPAGKHLRSLIPDMDMVIEQLKRFIDSAIPYTICPFCRGGRCLDIVNSPCQGSGYITERAYQRLSKDKQEWLAKRAG